MADPPACCSKQLAVVSMEMEGLAVKLNGYERALQDCELQVSSGWTMKHLQAFSKDSCCLSAAARCPVSTDSRLFHLTTAAAAPAVG